MLAEEQMRTTRWRAWAFVLVLVLHCRLASTQATDLDRTFSLSADLTPGETKTLINETAKNYIASGKKQKDYTYVQREEQQKLNSNGKVKSTQSRTSEVVILYKQKIERVIAEDDNFLSEKERATQEKRIQRALNEGTVQNPSFVLRKRLEEQETALAQTPDYMQEIISAYDYKFVGIEELNGRKTYVIDGNPRREFQPRYKDTRLLRCFSFRIWIDKAELQWVKLDAQFTSFFPFGLFPVRLDRGTRVSLENTRVNDEIWLPKHVLLMVDARVGLLKGFHEELQVSYGDYKKFRSDTKITDVRDLQRRQ